MGALGDARVVTRAEVEALLALVEQVHSPNNGTIAQLCRTWLAVDAAPVVDIFKYRGSIVIEPDDDSVVGKRVRLVAIDTKGGGNLPPPLGGGDGG